MAILTVGTGEQFQTIAAAADAAAAGDTIDVAAGTYTNDFITLSQSVTLQAVGGTVDLVATVDPPDGKAIIDEGGAGVAVAISGFDISGAAVADNNGAGIRYEGGTLTLSNMDIHNNQEGLLGNVDPAGTIAITSSSFTDNGSGTGYTHNIYVGAIADFSISGSTIEAANVGHDIKSRAAVNSITDNLIADGPTGDSSYEIDLPNGGGNVITGNVIEKGPEAQNENAIISGEEGNLYADSSLTVANNAIINDLASSGSTVLVNDTGVAATVTGNLLWGWIETVNGPANLSGNTTPATEPAFSTLVPGQINGGTACFHAGTRILTSSGETAVERLRVGDRLPARHTGAASIVWIGHRKIDCRRHASAQDVWPVRVRRGAFADGAPHRDLLLSPDHAVAWDGVLIPIRYLVNGASIVQEPHDAVEYWHVELARHDIILAEGLAVESYLDTGNRSSFANGGPALRLHADFARHVWSKSACAKLALGGIVCRQAREHLLRRAAALGHAVTREPALHLAACGQRISPHGHAMDWFFDVPAQAQDIRLVSRSMVPAWLQPESDDRRRLGVAVAAISVDGMPLPLDDRRLGAGWHRLERSAGHASAVQHWRWTDGAAMLHLAGARQIHVRMAMPTSYWREPSAIGRAAPIAA